MMMVVVVVFLTCDVISVIKLNADTMSCTCIWDVRNTKCIQKIYLETFTWKAQKDAEE
jgi:hypothetical protein